LPLLDKKPATAQRLRLVTILDSRQPGDYVLSLQAAFHCHRLELVTPLYQPGAVTQYIFARAGVRKYSHPALETLRAQNMANTDQSAIVLAHRFAKPRPCAPP